MTSNVIPQLFWYAENNLSDMLYVSNFRKPLVHVNAFDVTNHLISLIHTKPDITQQSSSNTRKYELLHDIVSLFPTVAAPARLYDRSSEYLMTNNLNIIVAMVTNNLASLNR